MSSIYTYALARYPEDFSEESISKLIELNQHAYRGYLTQKNIAPWSREEFKRQLRLGKTLVLAYDNENNLVGFSFYRECGNINGRNYLKLGALGNCSLEDKLTVMLPNMYCFLAQTHLPNTTLWTSVPKEPTTVELFLMRQSFVTCTDNVLAKELITRARIKVDQFWTENQIVYFQTRFIRKILTRSF